MNNSNGTRLPMRILSFAFFPLGLGAILLGVVDIVDGIHSNNWTSTVATILSSRIDSRWAPTQPEVRYRFEWNGQMRVSKQIWPGSTIVDFPILRASSANTLIAKFPAGATVSVKVNPRGDQSALIVGPERAVAWTGFCLLVLLLGSWAPLAIDRWFKE